MDLTARPADRPVRPVGRMALVWVLVVAFWLTSAVVVALPGTGGTGVQVTVGQSANQDILAPAPLSYESAVLTDRSRAEAAAGVPDVYDAPDTRVARQQVLLLRDVLDFVDSVRADSFATQDQRETDLVAVNSLSLPAEAARLLLTFDASAWVSVKDESLTVLEQLMRGQVRVDQVGELRRSVPARVSVSLTEAQGQVVTALVANLIAPNSFYNAAATEAARQAARDAVEPVMRHLVRGQAVVTRGEVVTPEDVEALSALGLLETESSWREPAAAALAVLIVGALVVLYVARYHPDFGDSPRRVLLLGLLFTVFLLAARLMVPGRTVLPFLFPAAAMSMLLTVFVSANLAMLMAVALAILVGFVGGNSLELTTFLALGGILAPIAVGRGERLNQFFWSGLAVAVANVVVLLVFRLPDPALDPLGLAQLLAAAVLNGAVSASLTLAGFFTLGALFDITTSLQLIELSRPDHPLLQFILRNAPGTYQHSLQVANLAEQAAERIGANAMLTRVGALYHDTGKAMHPQFFVENQLEGINIHETLEPLESARIIIGHIRDGLEMTRRHRLPSAIRAFIPEHHGTNLASYQYKRAVTAAGGDPALVDISQFQYPGPRPQSKETALLMLADGCEAWARADRPKTEADVDKLVKTVIEDRQAAGQLDDSDLTVRDLALIRESFVATLRGVFHPRIEYPKDPRPALPAPQPAPPALPAARPTAQPPEQQPRSAN